MKPNTDFDDYVQRYDEVLDSSLRITGKDRLYYARKRSEHMAKLFQRLEYVPSSALDYGCGDGMATVVLKEILQLEEIHGVDTSSESIKVANERYRRSGLTFALLQRSHILRHYGMAYCNGVFHHIAPEDRPATLNYIRSTIVSGGYFAFWENNPYNLGTRYLMRVTPFDADAIPLTPHESKRLLENAGFTIIRTDFLFFFPRFLWPVLWSEGFLTKLPLGGQYLHLARRIEE